MSRLAPILTLFACKPPAPAATAEAVASVDSSTSTATSGADWAPRAGKARDDLLLPEEVHLAELRQLTFGGDNAEAYWSPDGRSLIYQFTGSEGCDQEYILDLDSGQSTLLSSGKGRTTCGYYSWPDGDRFIYATTEGGGEECPAVPSHTQGYVWPVYDTYDLVWQTAGGTPEPFVAAPGYDAEATVCFSSGRVVFTSTRDGDLDLYSVNADGTDLVRLTNTPGYDGGAFFTTDCSEIVWRASRPQDKALEKYQSLLAEGLVKPGHLEIYMMNADGSNVRQLTNNGEANFGPYPLPDASAVIYSSNQGGSIREFDLWMVSRDGGPSEQVTFAEGFDGFPMFSPDGNWLVFGSNRGGVNHETNLFVARWK